MGLKYRPEIDGLRAIAVIPVILFHAGFHSFAGGYTGVDVFFVISGFLITSILYGELEANKFSLVNFYERRARRILPLLFFILLLTIPFAWMSLFQSDIIDYFESLIAIPTFVSNFLFVMEADYFDTATELKPLLHTWSLAVEEQYYIFFPLVMMLFFKKLWKHKLLMFISVMCLLSFAFSEWASHDYAKYNFFLLPSRIWEIGAGAILAILMKSQNPVFEKVANNETAANGLSIIGLLLIIGGMFFLTEGTRFPSAYAIPPVLGTFLVIGFANQQNIIGKILSWKPMIFVGLISYSMYLWHQPVFAFVKHMYHEEQSFLLKLILSVSMIPLSWLSWKYVENPFRNKQRFDRKFIFTWSIIGSLFFIGVGVLGVYFKGFPNREINKRLQVANYNPDNRVLQLDSWKHMGAAQKALPTKNQWFATNNPLPNVLLVGNSHSKDMFNVLSQSDYTSEYEFGRMNTQISEIITKGKMLKSKNFKDADYIVLSSRYRGEDLPYMEQVVEQIIKAGKPLVIIKEIFNFKLYGSKTHADVLIQKSANKGEDLTDVSHVRSLIEESDKFYYQDYSTNEEYLSRPSDVLIDKLKDKYPSIVVLDRMDYICNSGSQECYSLNEDLEKYFYDYGHHSAVGSKFFAGKVKGVDWFSVE